MQVPLVIGEVRHDRALHSHVLSDQHGECIPIREIAYGMTVSDRVSFQVWLWTQRPCMWPYEALWDSHKATKKDCAMKSAELKVQEWNCNVGATYSNSKHMVWQMILNGNVLYLRRSQRLHRRKIVGVLPPKAVFYFWPFSSTSQCCLSQLTHQIFQTNIGRARRQ